MVTFQIATGSHVEKWSEEQKGKETMEDSRQNKNWEQVTSFFPAEKHQDG